jgi:hypothetical protein
VFPKDTFKNSSGKIITLKLFIELCYETPEHAVFSLKEDDLDLNGKRYVSLQKLYLAYVPSDPTEYTFAKNVFGSWNIWETVRNSAKVKPHVDKWRREADVIIKSRAIQAIAEEAKEGKNAFQAAKLLLDRGWIEKNPPPPRNLVRRRSKKKR